MQGEQTRFQKACRRNLRFKLFDEKPGLFSFCAAKLLVALPSSDVFCPEHMLFSIALYNSICPVYFYVSIELSQHAAGPPPAHAIPSAPWLFKPQESLVFCWKVNNTFHHFPLDFQIPLKSTKPKTPKNNQKHQTFPKVTKPNKPKDQKDQKPKTNPSVGASHGPCFTKVAVQTIMSPLNSSRGRAVAVVGLLGLTCGTKDLVEPHEKP